MDKESVKVVFQRLTPRVEKVYSKLNINIISLILTIINKMALQSLLLKTGGFYHFMVFVNLKLAIKTFLYVNTHKNYLRCSKIYIVQ